MSEVRFPMQPLSALTTALKDGTHGTHRRVVEGVPLLSAKNITANGDIAIDDTDDLISEAEYLDLTRSFRLEPNDLLLTIVGSLGRRAIYSGQRITFQRSVAYVRPQQQKVVSRFLFHWMGHPSFSAELARRSNATAQAGLYLGELAKVSVPVPEIREQGVVTQILDTLDTAIHATEAIIAKLKAVKQGLLHDLLTRGLDANGELRPPQAEAPHLYKESPLGWIPKEWAASRVELEFVIDSGITLGPHRVPRCFPRKYLRVANVHRGRLVLNDIAEMEASAKEMEVRALQPDDLLIVEGHASTSEIGRCAIADESVRGMLFQNHLFRLRSRRLLPAFGLLWLNSHFAQAYWRREAATSSGLNTINRTKLCQLEVVVPPHDEQLMVANREAALTRRLDAEARLLAKLQTQKSALMDDLLTGRVRVTPLLTAEHPQKSA